MYPSKTLGDAPPLDGIIFGGAGAALSTTAVVRIPSAEQTQGGPVGTDAGAETGPHATVTSGTGARRALAERLFAANYPKLAGWVRRLVDDDETAHEIASEAFTRLLSRWSSLENPQSYLYMIATNLVRDHWRKMERERRALRAAALSASQQDQSQAGDVDVRDLIQSLPLRQRNAFLLHYYAGFAVREVAAMLGRPEGTIKADLFQARARLRSALGMTND
jgi:RNA polymerase sigma-70 factor, ECF subfamily